MENITCSCGATNDYHTTESGPHLKATCNQCGRYIKFISKENKKPALYFGKYKGRELSSMNSEDEVKYLKWLYLQPDLKNNLKSDIENQLKRLNRL